MLGDDERLRARVRRAGRAATVADRVAADGRDRALGRRRPIPARARSRRAARASPTRARSARRSPTASPTASSPSATSRCTRRAPLVHGADERIDVRDLGLATDFFRQPAARCSARRDNQGYSSCRICRLSRRGPAGVLPTTPAPTDAQIEEARRQIVAAVKQVGETMRESVLTAVNQAHHSSFSQSIQNFFTDWAPVLTALFMVAIFFVLWRTLKLMPRTKPQQIKPHAKLEVALGRHRRRRRGQAGAAARSSSSCATPSASAARRQGAHGASCCTARPAPARRCWPRPSRTSRARSSSPSRRRRSSRCSPASAPRASGACSTRRARTRRRSSSSTSSTRSAPQRGTDINGERDQTLNQLLVEMDGFESTDADRRRDRRLQPAREARPGAAAPRPLRPPDLRLAARRQRAASGILRVHTRDKPLGETSTSTSSPSRRAASRAPTWPTSATRRRSSPRAAQRRDDLHRRDFDARARARRRRHAVATRRSTTTRSASSPTTRPATRSARSCCSRSTACTRSRSSRAGRRSATR